MFWLEFLGWLFVWSFIGSFALVISTIPNGGSGALGTARGWEFVNPIHIYKHNHVNWFGAIIVALIYNALCPIGAVCYWVYKLCTVGRK